MLRTTVSRFKRACSGAVISRILKGDAYGGPVSCAAVRKSYKSTKSTDDGKKDSVASEEDYDEKKSKGNASEDELSPTKYIQIEEPSIPLTQREKCQRIIDKAFGACEHTEHDKEVTPTYFSHNVNLEDTRREIMESERAKLEMKEHLKIRDPIVPESRIQYNLITRELINDDNNDEIALSNDSMSKVPAAAKGHKLTDEEDLAKTWNIHITAAEEPNLTKNYDGIETTEDNAPLVESYSSNAKEDVGKFMNNPESIENKALRDDDAETIELVKDDRKQYMYEKAIPQEEIDTVVPYQRTQFGAYSLFCEDEDQDEIILIDSMMKLPPIACYKLPTICGEDLLTDIEEVEECATNREKGENKTLRGVNFKTIKMDNYEKKHMFINATTAKEEEEQLTQKLETIEETPLVEAQVPKVEGFNVTPRVLGDQPVFNTKSIEDDEDYILREPVLPAGDLDDVAKRCLKCPLGRIDEILINEMEKSPFSKTEGNAASKGLLGDMLVKVDEVKSLSNSNITEQEIHSQSREFEAADEETYVVGLTSPTPPHIAIDIRLPDLNEETEEHPKEATEDTSQLKTNTLNPHLVTEIHVLGIDSMEDAERAANIVNTKATLSEEFGQCYISKDEQNTQYTKVPEETETTYSNAETFDSQKDALQDYMIRYERLLQPEYMIHFKGVHNPSYLDTVNASDNATDELQFKETDRQCVYARNLSTSYLWGQAKQNASDSKLYNFRNEIESDANEHGQTPQGQMMDGERVEHEEITMNKRLERAPYTNFRVPGQKWENNVNYLSEVDRLAPIDSHKKSYSTKEATRLKPRQEHEKEVSITDAIFREHELDPYYVLACNETCPIAPVSSVSTHNYSDFVDTTETIYMKKNICESIRPKPLPRDVKKMACEKMPSETQALHELDVKLEPEIIPESSYIATQEAKPACTTDTQQSLPKLGEQVSLSELLRRVRQRSRLECLSALRTLRLRAEPTVGKCNRKAPRCPPTAPRSPPLNPVPPPSFGLPMLKRRPPVCKAPKKKGGCKFSTCDMDVSCGVQSGKICPEMAYELNEAEVIALRSKADLTEVFADHLHNLGKVMSGVLRQAKSSAETFFARDYDPWTPIPSWPSPQKDMKKKWQPATPCNYRCPIYPKARASMNPDPPCDVKPCEGFPKRRSFSMLDCFAVSLDDVESEVK